MRVGVDDGKKLDFVGKIQIRLIFQRAAPLEKSVKQIDGDHTPVHL